MTTTVGGDASSRAHASPSSGSGASGSSSTTSPPLATHVEVTGPSKSLSGVQSGCSRLHTHRPGAMSRIRATSACVAGDEQPAIEPLGDGGGAVVDPELGVDVHEVGLDGRLGDEQLGRGVAIARSLGDELEHLQLALA